MRWDGAAEAIEHRRAIAEVGRKGAAFLREIGRFDVILARAARKAGAGQQRFEDGWNLGIDDAAAAIGADPLGLTAVDDGRPTRDAAFRFVFDDPVGEARARLRTYADFVGVADLDRDRAAIQHIRIGDFFACQWIDIDREGGYQPGV